jgi:hypothetical protein
MIKKNLIGLYLLMSASVVSGNTEKPNPVEYPIIARVNGSTVHLYLTDKPAVTGLYDPGCSGLDIRVRGLCVKHCLRSKEMLKSRSIVLKSDK